MAVPIIIRNSENRIALIMQDNAPVWRVFGNGFKSEQSIKNSRKGLYYDEAQRILRLETNLPLRLRRKTKAILSYELVDALTGYRKERNRVFVLDIKDFKLESKKGCFVEYFNADERPDNMYAYHARLFDMAVKQLTNNPNKELCTGILITVPVQENPRMAVLDELVRNNGIITGLEKWRNHPKVEMKRLKGDLLRDL